jgi:WD40 repeat protein
VESDICVSEEIGPINSDTNAVWSLDGNLILAHDGKIKFYKPSDTEFQEVKSLDSRMDNLDYLEYSPDGKYLIFTGYGNQLYLYSLSTGASEEIFDSHESIRIVGWVVIE